MGVEKGHLVVNCSSFCVFVLGGRIFWSHFLAEIGWIPEDGKMNDMNVRQQLTVINEI